MKRGFVLTLDAFLAITLVAILLLGIFYTLSIAEINSFSRTRLSKYGNDALVVLDKNQTLDRLDSTSIGNALPIIGGQFNAVLRVKTNYYSNSRFQENATFSVGIPDNARIPDDTEIGYAKRLFLTFSGGRISQYSVAEIWVWAA